MLSSLPPRMNAQYFAFPPAYEVTTSRHVNVLSDNFSRVDQYLVILLRLCMIFTAAEINRDSVRLFNIWVMVSLDER